MSTETTDLINVPQLRKDYLRTHYQNYPVNANRASMLGHPCLRYLTYVRTRWQERAIPELTLLSIFEEGKLHEDAVIDAMRRAGIRAVEQQRAFAYPEHQITGMIDGQLHSGDELIPFDVKSASSYTFRELNVAEDLRHHRYVHVRNWYSQLVLYCLLGNKPRSLIILKDKATGELKQIVVPLDYEHAEELIKKADAVNAHVAAGTLPDRMPYDQEICGRCDMFHICLPDEALRAGATLTDDPELEGKLRRRAELEQAAREFGRLDEEIKKQSREQLGENGEAIVSVDWIVRTSTRPRKGYSVEPGLVTSVKIERLGKSGAPDA